MRPNLKKNPEFLHIRQLLEQGHIRVPALIAADVEAGFLLLEDLGDDVLLPILSNHSAGPWYASALSTLNRVAAIPVATIGAHVLRRRQVADRAGFVSLLVHPPTVRA